MNRLNQINSHFASANPLTAYRKQSNIDAELMKYLQFGDHYALMKEFESHFVTDKIFHFRNDTAEEISREEMRIRANERMKVISKNGKEVMDVKKYFEDPYKFQTVGNATYIYSMAISTKYAVMALYYKAIENLGTAKHEKFLDRIQQEQDIGCFALTELGHGSNVRGIGTTAHLDTETQEFIINTPEDLAMKFWIGGAAKTANITALWAQLYDSDGKCHGPHVFIVPLRDRQTHQPLPGIILGDCGKKGGQDAIDNGFILFNNFRIPKDNFLDRFSQIDKVGKFTTEIPNPDTRFGLSLGSLSGGRLLLVGGAAKILGYACKIAIRFAAMRRQFSKPGEKEETFLIEYPLHQFRLFPYVAQTIAMTCAAKVCFGFWTGNLQDIFNPKNDFLGEMHAIGSATKAIFSWTTMKGIQECREACGGLGYSNYSKLGILRANYDVNQTWEGDNNVLLMQTSKFLLDCLQLKMKGKDIKFESMYWLKGEPVEDEKILAKDAKEFLNHQSLLSMFEHRCNLLLMRSGMQIMGKVGQMSAVEAFNDTQVFYMNDTSKAFGELFVVKSFYDWLKSIKTNDDTLECMNLLFEIHCLSRILADLGTFREYNYITADHEEMIKVEIINLCGKVKRHMVPLFDHIYPGDEMLDSMIAPSNGDLYGSIINRIYTAPKVFDRISSWKDLTRDQL